MKKRTANAKALTSPEPDPRRELLTRWREEILSRLGTATPDIVVTILDCAHCVHARALHHNIGHPSDLSRMALLFEQRDASGTVTLAIVTQPRAWAALYLSRLQLALHAHNPAEPKSYAAFDALKHAPVRDHFCVMVVSRGVALTTWQFPHSTFKVESLDPISPKGNYIIVQRPDVETCNTAGFLSVMEKFRTQPQVFRQQIEFGLHTFDAEGLPLPDIPLARAFLRRLWAEFPCWFYYLDPLETNVRSSPLTHFFLCLSKNCRRATRSETDRFVAKGFRGMNEECERAGDSHAVNVQMTNRIFTWQEALFTPMDR